MKRLAAALVVVALAACGDVSATSNTQAAPGKPLPAAFTAAQLKTAQTFITTHPEAEHGGHETDGYVIAVTRNGNADSTRFVVYTRSEGLLILDPWNAEVTDTLVALIGTGDWVVVHLHDHYGDRTLEGAHDLRLVQKAAG